jgi:hypothetical protein
LHNALTVVFKFFKALPTSLAGVSISPFNKNEGVRQFDRGHD